ncbi:MAG TPA: DNA replication complex GINS family protein [Thermoplasmata archaeon]|nr:DNA replication complex GINS family protein [Thermoplasmata archaeon]
MAEQRGDMNYEDIMTLFRQENRSPQLTKVDPALYDRISAYIKSIRKESEREIGMNPSSHASMMLNDQLKKAIDKAKRVYELRTRKISLIALRKVSGDNPDTANLTPDELVLFSSLTSVLAAHKDSNADFEILGPRTTRQEEMVEVPTMKKEAPKVKAKAEEVPPENDGDGLVMARVLEDVPTFAGVDRDYKLRKEDVVSIPKSVADTLLSHGKIKIIGSS